MLWVRACDCNVWTMQTGGFCCPDICPTRYNPRFSDLRRINSHCQCYFFIWGAGPSNLLHLLIYSVHKHNLSNYPTMISHLACRFSASSNGTTAPQTPLDWRVELQRMRQLYLQNQHKPCVARAEELLSMSNEHVGNHPFSLRSNN